MGNTNISCNDAALVITEGGDNTGNHPSFFSITRFVGIQAKTSPHKIAVKFGDERLTYRELEHRSNQLAHFLRSKGVREEIIVPLMMERSLEMIISILGILKAGGAYAPIDPKYPQERVDLILKETKASILLTHERAVRSTLGLTRTVDITEWSHVQPYLNLQPTTEPTINIAPHHLAYVIFTSGSTGTPKGVMVEHAALAFSTLSRISYYSRFSNLLLVPSFSFDASIGAIFGSLCNGDCLVVCTQEELQTPHQLRQILSNINTLLCVPSYYEFLLNEDLIKHSYVSKVILGGENISQALVSKHFSLANTIRLFNEYGPTEATVWTTVDEVKPENQIVSIGTPIEGSEIHILDKSGNLVQHGAIGELHIAGRGLSRGYLNDTTLTRQRYISNPVDLGTRIYKTGDLVYQLPDGRLVYVGRLDEQVKINGHRIELGEIESVLLQHEKVKQAAVQSKQLESGNEALVAFIVPQGDLEQSDLQEYLNSKLPAYMVPKLWVKLVELPLTPNGKIDKKALSHFKLEDHIIARYEAPRNSTEEALLIQWKKHLQLDIIGIHDNFFELGGNSLMAMGLISGIRRKLLVEISLKDLLKFPTIAELSGHLSLKSRKEQPVKLLAANNPKPVASPLSYSQESLWFIDQLEGSVPYHLPVALKITGEIDVNVLNKSLKQLFERHEVLRAAIVEKNGLRHQYPLSADDWELKLLDGDLFGSKDQLQDEMSKFIRAPFILSKDVKLRAALIKVSPSEHVLLLVIHHIVFDAWSKTLLLTDLLAYYRAYKNGTTSTLDPLPVQFSDYAIWQRKQFEGSAKDKLDYWKAKLDGITPLQLPNDFNPSTSSSAGAVKRFVIPSQLSDRLKHFSISNSTTLFMTLLAGFKALLYRYSAQEDICVGTAIAGREEPETEKMVGYFVNSLALRTKVSGKSTFLELLALVKSTTLEAFEHRDVPFEKVAAQFTATREKHQNPLFQVMFNYQNVPLTPPLDIEGLHLSLVELPQHHSKFDLTFSLSDSTTGLDGIVEYRTALYQPDTIDNMVSRYLLLLQSLVVNPTEQVGKADILTPQERHRLLYTFNPPPRPYPKQQTILDLIEEQTQKTPDGLAITFGEKHLTYQQLDKRSNQLAHLLRSKGVKEEVLVLLCMPRSLEMVVGMLGILKAGGAYVPIDPEYPQERIRYIQKDTSATVVVSSSESLSKLDSSNDLETILMDTEWSAIQHFPSTKAINALRQEHLSYVIYTSGSTGNPKGVMIEHKNIFSFICWCKEEFNPDVFDILYAPTSICFDLSIFEIFYPLSIGKPIRLLLNGLEINQYLPRDSSVMINTVPTVIDHLLDEGLNYDRISAINMAGEPIPQKVLQRLDAERTEVRNLYGPTEDTTYSTVYRIKNSAPLLIGQPISNTSIYILNPESGLNPVGVPGEIWIAGSGLSRGYLNNKELTEEKFVPNHFSEDPSAKLYRTGDIGRWISSGQIEYLGRKDDQVKIRGFRIELGEIEKVLQLMDGVKQAVVLAEDDHQGNKQLVGYVVYEKAFEKRKFVDFLKQKLPGYMVPSQWVSIDAMPLTPNGKINKKALPKIGYDDSFGQRYVAPQTPLEKELAEIWGELLQIDQVGLHDDFFLLGGHSMLVTKMLSSLHKRFNTDLRIKDIFTHPTIYGLTREFDFVVKSADLGSGPKLEIRPEQIALSYNQESLWFIDKLNGSVPYHIPTVLKLSGNVDDDQIRKALKVIIDRHEVLRTVITDVNGSPIQSIVESSEWVLSIIDDESLKNDPDELRKFVSEIIHEPFDLAHDYMIRASLIHLGPNNHLLVLVLHHIASDGWSIPLLIKELTALLSAYHHEKDPVLPLLPLQYADFTVWQRKHLQKEVLGAKVAFWKEKLNDLPYLRLPLDYPRPAVQSFRGSVKTFEIDKRLRDRLVLLGQEHGATLFMTLLTAFKLMLNRFSSQKDICVGTVTAGRQHHDVDKLIGYFVNPLPIRSWVDIEGSFEEVMETIKANCLEAFENQEVPFDQIVANSGTKRDLGKNPLFQVMFILQNIPKVLPIHIGDVQISDQPLGQTTSKFDLSFIVSDSTSKPLGTVEYCSDLFSAATIDQMIQTYLSFLNLMVSKPADRVKKHYSHLFNRQGIKVHKSIIKNINPEGYLEKLLPAVQPEENKWANTSNIRLIAKIWGKALGIKKINIYDNFFEIGGHSLIAVQVMTHLEKQLGVKLPLSILFKYPTVHQLAKVIDRKGDSGDWSSLVPIKPEGKNLPLYIVHGGGSNILPFYSIGKNMDPEQPVYGLQPQGLNGKDTPLASVEAIASHFVDEIISHNAIGPYCLAGYSFGGMIAFEMARQLKAQNKEVKKLILFDTLVYESDQSKNLLSKLMSKLAYHFGKRRFDVVLFSQHPSVFKRLKTESLQRKLTALKIWAGVEKKKPDSPAMKAIKNIENIHKQAWQNYNPRPYDGPIYLLKAKIPTHYVRDPQYLGWKPYANQIIVKEMEGEHTTMFSPPNDVNFSRVLQDILQKYI